MEHYSKLNKIPSQGTWDAMNSCLDKYVDNANLVDKLLQGLFSNMCAFAERNDLKIEHEQDIRKRLVQMKHDSSYATEEWSIDELPLYE